MEVKITKELEKKMLQWKMILLRHHFGASDIRKMALNVWIPRSKQLLLFHKKRVATENNKHDFSSPSHTCKLWVMLIYSTQLCFFSITPPASNDMPTKSFRKEGNKFWKLFLIYRFSSSEADQDGMQKK